MNYLPQSLEIFIFFSSISLFEPDINFKESLFDCTYKNKLWNKLHLKVFYRKKKIVFRKILTAKMELFVALVSSFKPLTNFMKNPNLVAMGVMNAPLEYYNVLWNLCMWSD